MDYERRFWFSLQPAGVYHDAQVEGTFNRESTDRIKEMKSWGCKVLNMDDIMKRKDKRDVEKSNVVHVRQDGSPAAEPFRLPRPFPVDLSPSAPCLHAG